MISWISHRIGYAFLWCLYQVFKYRFDAFGTVPAEDLGKIAEVAEKYDIYIAAHFRTLQKEAESKCSA